MNYEPPQIPYSYYESFVDQQSTISYVAAFGRAVGVEEAIIIRRFMYFWKLAKARGHREMFMQANRFCKPVGLTLYAFRTCMTKWEKMGIIVKLRKGVGFLTYYTVNEEVFAKYMTHLNEKGQMNSQQVLEADAPMEPNKVDETKDAFWGVEPALRKQKTALRNENAEARNENAHIMFNGKCLINNTVDSRRSPGLVFTGTQDSIYDKMSKQLEVALKEARRFEPVSKPKTWPKEFMQLVHSGVTEQTIQKVLDWYCQNIKRPFAPKAFSAKAFKLKFIQITDAMERAVPAKPEKQSISEQVQAIVDSVKALGWPKHTNQNQLESSIITSIQNYKLWKSNFVKVHNWLKTQKLVDRKGWPTVEAGLLEVSTATEMLRTHSTKFILTWFKIYQKNVGTWIQWSGNTTAFVFNADHKDFVTMAESLCIENGIKIEKWNTLHQKVKTYEN